MAGKIIADTLEHSTAGSIATNYVVEGSAKVWANVNASGTPATQDSNNLSSITDTSAGVTTFTFTNGMNDANYASYGTVRRTDDSNGNPYLTGYHLPTTTTVRFTIIDFNGTETDSGYISMSILGDLA